MMYNQKLVASIKSKGKILREFKDTVYVKFGSEYSILLKNLNSVRVIANVYIDGENAVPGGLVLNAGQTVDLERWIKNGNLTEGNRFKFIERTGDIEDHRGIKLEDGLVRIEYQFEQVLAGWGQGWDHYNSPVYSKGLLRGGGSYCTVGSATSTFSAQASTQQISTQSFNDVGITVPGSKSEQQFTTVAAFPTEVEKHVIVLKLLGETADNKPVLESVSVKHKPRCVTCGQQNRAHANFCAKCGTALEIYA
mgnify:CR=1 FL=1